MNQKKIGEFIAKSRKKKNLTQEQLAERLGVSDRTVGNWENGRNMPDLSLFKPLCDELGITINEFLSGEKIDKKDYQEKFEENIINTIDYSNNKIKLRSNIIGLLLMVFGLFISISALSMFKSESSWGAIFTYFGCFVSSIGLFVLIRKIKIIKRILLCIAYFIIFILLMVFIDFLSVINIHQAPRFRVSTMYIGEVIYYDNLFYDVMRCDVDSKGETFNVVPNKHYTDEELFNYCKDLRISRVKQRLKDNQVNSIIVGKLVFPEDNDYDDDATYMYDTDNRRFKVVKRLDDKKDINEIVNIVKNVEYPEFINAIGYIYTFFLYHDDELVLSFTENEINTGIDHIGIGINNQDTEVLHEYTKE